MKRIITLFLACILLTGCAAPVAQSEAKIYEATFLELFDTITVIKGPAESKEAFSAIAYKIRDELLFYHQLFDIYEDYDGVAIECQNFPDAPNQSEYPSAVLRPGEVYEQAIIFAFGIR